MWLFPPCFRLSNGLPARGIMQFLGLAFAALRLCLKSHLNSFPSFLSHPSPWAPVRYAQWAQNFILPRTSRLHSGALEFPGHVTYRAGSSAIRSLNVAWAFCVVPLSRDHVPLQICSQILSRGQYFPSIFSGSHATNLISFINRLICFKL